MHPTDVDEVWRQSHGDVPVGVRVDKDSIEFLEKLVHWRMRRTLAELSSSGIDHKETIVMTDQPKTKLP